MQWERPSLALEQNHLHSALTETEVLEQKHSWATPSNHAWREMSLFVVVVVAVQNGSIMQLFEFCSRTITEESRTGHVYLPHVLRYIEQGASPIYHKINNFFCSCHLIFLDSSMPMWRQGVTGISFKFSNIWMKYNSWRK